MKEKYLIVKGCAGLGNRLFTVCNAIEYSKKSDRTIFIDWCDGQFAKKGVNAFTAYFDLINTDHVNSLNEIPNIENHSFYPKNWKNIIEKSIYDSFVVSENNFSKFIPYKFIPKGSLKMLNRYWQYIENTSHTASVKPKNHFTSIFNSKNFPFGSDLPVTRKEDIIIFADFSPAFSDKVFLNHIRLKKSIEEKINQFTESKNLSKNSIGIHVRSTDKQPTQSIDLLFKKIENLSLNKPKIFLATDNKFVLQEFTKKYPGLITYPKFLADNIKEGLHQYAIYNNKQDTSLQLFEDSIMDMWLLSKCEYLFYQGNSSFSLVSKLVHNNKDKCYNWLNN